MIKELQIIHINRKSSKRRSPDYDVQEKSSTSRSLKLANAMDIIVNDDVNSNKGKGKDHVEENLQIIENIDNENANDNEDYESYDTE